MSMASVLHHPQSLWVLVIQIPPHRRLWTTEVPQEHGRLTLYLLCWGEAAQVRFCPECLCFIFKCADDYYRSSECQNRVEPVPEGLYLRAVIKPLYRFIRDQGYEVVDGKFVRRERDHQDIIGYDDVNQLFWYPEGIARIVLNDKVCCFGFSTLLVLIPC